jgi:hypothetical protein
MAFFAPHDLYNSDITHILERSVEQHCWLYDELPTQWSDEADAATVKAWILRRYGNVKVRVLAVS